MSKIFENGPDRVLEEVQSAVEFFFEDADEIGSSDISCCVISVIEQFYKSHEEAADWEFDMVRNGVMNAIHDL